MKRETSVSIQDSFDEKGEDEMVVMLPEFGEFLPEEMKTAFAEALKIFRESEKGVDQAEGGEKSAEKEAASNGDEDLIKKIQDMQTQLDQMKQEQPDMSILSNKNLQGDISTISAPHIFRREFKIQGQIASETKESLNYVSLCSQVTEGKWKGYPDEEIASAVRKAVSTGTSLRTYLDSIKTINAGICVNEELLCIIWISQDGMTGNRYF